MVVVDKTVWWKVEQIEQVLTICQCANVKCIVM
jgi:hypothetical protein